ncbi:MAG: hypothetical protein V4615_04825 [Bacteroidota bacterium]
MNISSFNKFLYALAGSFLLIAGIATTLMNTGLMPAYVIDVVTKISGPDLNALHLLQEFGSIMVFAGVMCFWFIKHYESSTVFHWAFTVFLALLALIHWLDVRGMRPSMEGPIINTIPFALFLIAGMWRRFARQL